MISCRNWFYLVCILLALGNSGCSREERKPAARPASPAPDKALIDVVYAAVKFQAAGSQTYQAPVGITIESRKVVRTEKGRKVDYAEISGVEQRGASLAAIVFRFPATWLTTERQNLDGLEAEMNVLTTCAQTLRANELQGKVQDEKAPCRMQAITADGKQGIAIVDDKVRHIEMLLYAVK